jgi:hypothetical protein
MVAVLVVVLVGVMSDEVHNSDDGDRCITGHGPCAAGYKTISADCPPPYSPCCPGYADYCPGDNMSVQVFCAALVHHHLWPR